MNMVPISAGILFDSEKIPNIGKIFFHESLVIPTGGINGAFPFKGVMGNNGPVPQRIDEFRHF
jgi:hypothetical protein